MTVTLSPSSLNLMKDCPRCFWVQFNKGIKRPNGIFPSLPSGIDLRFNRNRWLSLLKISMEESR